MELKNIDDKTLRLALRKLVDLMGDEMVSDWEHNARPYLEHLHGGDSDCEQVEVEVNTADYDYYVELGDLTLTGELSVNIYAEHKSEEDIYGNGDSWVVYKAYNAHLESVTVHDTEDNGYDLESAEAMRLIRKELAAMLSAEGAGYYAMQVKEDLDDLRDAIDIVA